MGELKQHFRRPVVKNISKDEPITKSHFFNSIMLNKKDFEFIEESKISIPIRFHDMNLIFKIFETSNFEFHLSYQDLDYISESLLQDTQMFENKTFSYHLPDYLNNYQLFDPISKNETIKKQSLKNLSKVINLSDNLSDHKQIYVSSLSQNSYKDKEEYYYKLKLFIDKISSNHNILFLPQWLLKKHGILEVHMILIYFHLLKILSTCKNLV